jgi:hypothetical protein
MSTYPASQTLDPKGRAILAAATDCWRLNRVAALVLADYLEEHDDARSDVVRAMAQVVPVQVGQAWEATSVATLTAAWSCHPRRRLCLAVRHATPCFTTPDAYTSTFDPWHRNGRVYNEIVAEVSLARRRQLLDYHDYRIRGEFVRHRLCHYHLSDWATTQRYFSQYFESLLSTPRRYPLESLVVLAFDSLLACLLHNLLNVPVRPLSVVALATEMQEAAASN